MSAASRKAACDPCRFSPIHFFILSAIIFFLPLIVLSLAAAGRDPVAAVTGGQVRGRLRAAPAGGAVFKGIPFAAPPVGEWRWREPQPVRPWDGVRDALEYGAPCAQAPAGWNDRVAAIGSEDCLTLNIWTPTWPAGSRLPVMFWVHGGGNAGGSAQGNIGIEPPFDGERLSRHGVIVVTVEYRLGILGFMAHPEMTAESPNHTSGNFGLQDQIAALQWVQANIAQFGGDPGRVTVFGQSAGAHDIGLMMTSPLARGLFHRAIAESGTVIIRGQLTPSLKEAEQRGVALAEKMKAPSPGALAFMRRLSAREVLKASPPYGSGGSARPEPNVDGYVIPKLPAAVFQEGGQAPIPLIIGNNGRERSLAGGPEALKKGVADFYGPLAPQAMKLYGLAGGAAADAYPPYGDAAAQFATDTGFRCSTQTIAGWHSSRFPVYQYEFTQGYEPEGARHSLELRYVFGMLTDKEREETDRPISDRMQEYWTQFAATGNPNRKGLPAWPKADPVKREYLEFSVRGPVVKNNLRRPFCDLFDVKLKQTMNR